MLEITIHPSCRDDLEAVGEFIQEFVAGGRLLPRTQQELTGLMEHGFVARNVNRVVGFAALEVYSLKLAEIRSLAVAEDVRGLGVGRRLVDCCLDRARDRQILEVMAVTSEEDFFRACGFNFTLPGEKKALFVQTRDAGNPLAERDPDV